MTMTVQLYFLNLSQNIPLRECPRCLNSKLSKSASVTNKLIHKSLKAKASLRSSVTGKISCGSLYHHPSISTKLITFLLN